MSVNIHKRHNVSALLNQIVSPAKYRKVVLSEEVGNEYEEICIAISSRYEIHFIEVGTDGDYVHLLVQSVQTYSQTKIMRTIKSITVRVLFYRIPSAKEIL
jgi:REP element-mobilizing transposase RayT